MKLVNKNVSHIFCRCGAHLEVTLDDAFNSYPVSRWVDMYQFKCSQCNSTIDMTVTDTKKK